MRSLPEPSADSWIGQHGHAGGYTPYYPPGGTAAPPKKLPTMGDRPPWEQTQGFAVLKRAAARDVSPAVAAARAAGVPQLARRRKPTGPPLLSGAEAERRERQRARDDQFGWDRMRDPEDKWVA